MHALFAQQSEEDIQLPSEDPLVLFLIKLAKLELLGLEPYEALLFMEAACGSAEAN